MTSTAAKTMPVILAMMLTPHLHATDSTAVRKVRFDYDLTVSTSFDNREYDKTALDVSRTLFGVRAQAAVGVRLQDGECTHRILGGIAPLYEFGGKWKWEPLLYYEFSRPLERCKFGIEAGAFPTDRSKAFYSDAFYSEAWHFYHKTFKGFQFSWTGRNFHYELGLDWMGQLTSALPDTREEFSVYSGGHHTFLSILKLGYSARMHHYACSMKASNVVDDILGNIYLETNLGHFCKMQRMLFRIGYLQAYQCDRASDDGVKLPGKGEFFLEARNWNVGITNHLLFGADMMPLYGKTDPAGVQYNCDNLFMGDPLLLRNAEGREFSFCDKIGIYYEPCLTKCKDLKLRVQCNFIFNAGFAGWQQLITVAYNLPYLIK